MGRDGCHVSQARIDSLNSRVAATMSELGQASKQAEVWQELVYDSPEEGPREVAMRSVRQAHTHTHTGPDRLAVTAAVAVGRSPAAVLCLPTYLLPARLPACLPAAVGAFLF